MAAALYGAGGLFPQETAAAATAAAAAAAGKGRSIFGMFDCSVSSSLSLRAAAIGGGFDSDFFIPTAAKAAATAATATAATGGGSLQWTEWIPDGSGFCGVYEGGIVNFFATPDTFSELLLLLLLGDSCPSFCLRKAAAAGDRERIQHAFDCSCFYVSYQASMGIRETVMTRSQQQQQQRQQQDVCLLGWRSMKERP